MHGNEQLIAQLKKNRTEVVTERRDAYGRRDAALEARKADGRRRFSDHEAAIYNAAVEAIAKLDEELAGIDSRMSHSEAEAVRAGQVPGKGNYDMVQRVLRGANGGDGLTARAYGPAWAATSLQRIRQASGGEQRAVIGGSVDLPTLLPIGVQAIPHPTRIVDLLGNRVNTQSYAYEALVQTARTNNAQPTPDNTQKPVSINTVTSVLDRVRAHAHLSEPLPLRIWQDEALVRDWLTQEMFAGVLDSIEHTAINGNGVGEQQTGVLGLENLSTPSDRTHVPYTTDLPTTLRAATTALQIIGVEPTGWVMHPSDAAAIDTLRWSTGGGFLSGGYQTDNRTGVSGSSDNIFGPSSVPRVVSPTCPQGIAILARWSDLGIFVYKSTTLDIDWYGDLYQKNQVQLRAEAFVGVNVLRPKSFAIVDLTP